MFISQEITKGSEILQFIIPHSVRMADDRDFNNEGDNRYNLISARAGRAKLSKRHSKDLSGKVCWDQVCYNSAVYEANWTLKVTSWKVHIVLEVSWKKMDKMDHLGHFWAIFSPKMAINEPKGAKINPHFH